MCFRSVLVANLCSLRIDCNFWKNFFPNLTGGVVLNVFRLLLCKGVQQLVVCMSAYVNVKQ